MWHNLIGLESSSWIANMGWIRSFRLGLVGGIGLNLGLVLV